MKEFVVDESIFDQLRSRILSSNKKKYKFSLNDILDFFYDNEVLLYHKYSDHFIEKILKNKTEITTREEEEEFYVEFIKYVDHLQQNIIVFQKNYLKFIKQLSEMNIISGEEFIRAIYKDVAVIFNNGIGDNKDEYLDIVLERFYKYFNNTLFRNFLTLFSNKILERFHNNRNICIFIIDMISNNRKILTLLKMENIVKKRYGKNVEGEKDYLFNIKEFGDKIDMSMIELIARAMLKKTQLKGSSLFSNQLRFFGYKRMKFMKSKEINGDEEYFNNNCSENVPQVVSIYSYDKSNDQLEIIKNIEEIFSQEEYLMNDVKENIHQLIRINFRDNKQKYVDFFNYLKVKDVDLFNKVYFYIQDTIDLFKIKV